MSDPEFGGGDLRTLSFAGFRIDQAQLEKLLRYQRALADRLAPGWDAEAMARAHHDALEAARLTAEEVERPLAVLRRFAGNRETAARLRAVAASAIGEERDTLRSRLATLDAKLRERDDPETVDRLLEHEPELVDLHRRTRDALGR
jgi:hypothetical protein